MAKNLDKKLRQLERQQEKIGDKIVTLKHKHARNLMNEARKLLGRAPITSKKPRAPRAASTKSAPKAANGGGKKAE